MSRRSCESRLLSISLKTGTNLDSALAQFLDANLRYHQYLNHNLHTVKICRLFSRASRNLITSDPFRCNTTLTTVLTGATSAGHPSSTPVLARGGCTKACAALRYRPSGAERVTRASARRRPNSAVLPRGGG
jgi:hypothetical protein